MGKANTRQYKNIKSNLLNNSSILFKQNTLYHRYSFNIFVKFMYVPFSSLSEESLSCYANVFTVGIGAKFAFTRVSIRLPFDQTCEIRARKC